MMEARWNLVGFGQKNVKENKTSSCNGSNSLSVFYAGVVTCVHIIKKISIGFIHVAMDKR